ncbi:MAG: araP 19 [Cyanobacteria bacterium RYN_339]|nr:araP 19 [Cyanobacteria bacterium RYN_339]
MNPARRGEAFWAVLMILPAVGGLALLVGLPTLGSFALSFTDWDLLGSPRWVGGANYAGLAQDPLFWRVLGQTFLFTALYVVLDVVLALGLALALNQRIRGLALFRAAYFLPVVSSMVVGAILWSWVFDPRFGVANAVLAAFHLGPVRWLQDGRTALPALVVVSVWKNLGYDMLLFLAGLQAVPTEQLEAAALDGAGPWQRFRHITVPWIGPSLVLVGMMATIRGFQTFDTVYLMTEGGPHRSTTLVGYWLFQNAFTYFKLGKASALAYVLFAVLAGLSALQWAARRRLAHQEAP